MMGRAMGVSEMGETGNAVTARGGYLEGEGRDGQGSSSFSLR
jgi:hypothetical protein